MWKFNLEWLNEDGETCRDVGRAEAGEIAEWVRIIDAANAKSDMVAEVKIPTEGDSDWSDSRVPALRVKKIDVVGGPTHSW